MTEAKVIDVIYENGVWKPIEKVDPMEGAIMRVHIRKAVDILTATSGMFKGKYDKRAIMMPLNFLKIQISSMNPSMKQLFF
ncbi:MAG: antitoxin family protein [Euryarchaeota archaeon]|nr:antitoxin family protein [Euryarchaeota archaeon]